MNTCESAPQPRTPAWFEPQLVMEKVSADPLPPADVVSSEINLAVSPLQGKLLREDREFSIGRRARGTISRDMVVSAAMTLMSAFVLALLQIASIEAALYMVVGSWTATALGIQRLLAAR